MRSIELKRISMDSSFILKFCDDNLNMLIDPWIIGPEIDGMKIFNCAYHNSKPLCFDEICNVDAIVISLPFSDHCHEESLVLFDDSIPIYASTEAFHRLKKDSRFFHRNLIEIGKSSVKIKETNISVSLLPTSSIFDFTHSGLIFEDQNSKILYAPHGLYLEHYSSQVIEEILNNKPFLLCLLPCSQYCLPFYLGGTVNLGLNYALKVAEILKPKYLIDIHSEQKISSGIISFISFDKEYPCYENIQEKFSSSLLAKETQIIDLKNYEFISL